MEIVMRNGMKRLIRILILLPLLFVAIGAAVVVDGLIDRIEPADVAVVPGSMVMPDGLPSARLQARLDRALELYRQNTVRFILVSGGTGKEGFSEGRVMRDYLILRNVPQERIIVDEFGNTTRDTARNAARAMQEQGLGTAIAVSQYFHLPRTRMALREAGIATVGTAHARYFDPRDIYSIAREIPALAAYWFGYREDG